MWFVVVMGGLCDRCLSSWKKEQVLCCEREGEGARLGFYRRVEIVVASSITTGAGAGAMDAWM